MGIDLGTILTDVTAAVGALTPVLDILDPAVGGTVTALSKLLAGVAAAEPTALALIDQIKSGAKVTQADLDVAISAYDATDDQFKADLNDRLSAT